ncbi:hypothetical protein R1flu_004648 [Riccia fluitans]|uniref:Uncharacterized protein n=1 Tax=Riccia fluitans TaxID=41844 RepID=A0ABD1YQX0_9MARC
MGESQPPDILDVPEVPEIPEKPAALEKVEVVPSKEDEGESVLKSKPAKSKPVSKEKEKKKLGSSPTYQEKHSKNVDSWLGKDFVPVIQALGKAGLKVIPEYWRRRGCYKILVDLVLKKAEQTTTLTDMLVSRMS